MKSGANWTNLPRLWGLDKIYCFGPVYIDKMSTKIENPFWISVLQSLKGICSTIQPRNTENKKRYSTLV